jgi:hypothetical protein
MRKKTLLLALIVVAFASAGSYAGEKNDTLAAVQKNDTVSKEKKKKVRLVPPEPYHWNVIKFNPTPMLIQGLEINNVTLSYERLITKNMSLALQVGYLVFPRIIDDTVKGDLAGIAITGRHKHGVNLALDYRYYPSSRNRRPAPDGLYIGTFISYYGFRWENQFDILNTTVDRNGKMTGKIDIVNIGFELGYQFIFWKRFSLDFLLFGPCVSMYSGSLAISGALDPDQIKNLDQETVQKILNRFPALKSIFSEEGLTFTGSKTVWSVGYRYSISLGFHF